MCPKSWHLEYDYLYNSNSWEILNDFHNYARIDSLKGESEYNLKFHIKDIIIIEPRDWFPRQSCELFILSGT